MAAVPVTGFCGAGESAGIPPAIGGVVESDGQARLQVLIRMQLLYNVGCWGGDFLQER